MNNLIIYSDGAYSSSRNQGGWAFVVISNEEKIYSNFDGIKDTTNNRMEIVAALEAMKWMKEGNIKSATIFTDSMYVIGTMALNWRRKKNNDLWIQMDEANNGLRIDWKHVKGHNGDKWNSHCDVLAVHGSHLILE